MRANLTLCACSPGATTGRYSYLDSFYVFLSALLLAIIGVDFFILDPRQAIYRPDWATKTQKNMKLPELPSQLFFKVSLRALLTRLLAETQAAVLVCHLPPLGEDPHAKSNAETVAAANACIDAVCSEFTSASAGRVVVVPLTQALFAAAEAARQDDAASSPLVRPPSAARVDEWGSRLYGCALRRYGLGAGWNDCGRLAGDFVVLTDGLHLNDRGARVVATALEKGARPLLRLVSKEGDK